MADAGRAAIADEIVADRVEMILQARLGQIVGDDLRPRRETGLDPSPRLPAALVRFLGAKPGRDHDAGVRGVGAARGRGAHHVALAHVAILALAPDPGPVRLAQT